MRADQLASGRDSGAPAEQVVLQGRVAECAELDWMLAAARSGASRVLVLHGEAGVGKSALLDYAAAADRDVRILRAVGVESDMELAFAALHQLCGPLLDRLTNLPVPQRDALQNIFGMRAGAPPDRLLVGLAVLNLLSDASEDGALLCLVDDAQWLDRASAQVFGFIGRRLQAESIVFLVSTRQVRPDLLGLPVMEITGLRDADARALLDTVTHSRLDPRIRDRIVAEANGNPLALLELPRGLTATQMAGGLGLLAADTVPGRIEETFLTRIAALAGPTRTLLLVAAAEPIGDPALVWRAAERLGVEADVAADGVDGLLSVGDRVIFRHPLVRSAAYRAASAEERRAAHRALAEVTDQDPDLDRRAWHLAAASVGPNEAVAAELERSAGRAQARGGLAAAAAFLQRSVALSERLPLRGGRALAAAEVSLHAGEFDLSRRMLAVAEAEATEELQQARVVLLRGQAAFASGRGRDAIPILLSAASKLQDLDPEAARETYLEAWSAAVFVGDPGGDASLQAVSAAAASLPAAGERGPADILLEGFVTWVNAGRIAAAPILRLAMATFMSPTTSAEDSLHWGWKMGSAPVLLWADEAWHAISLRQVELMRSVGALARLFLAVSSLAIVEAWRGNFVGSASATAEVEAVAEMTGTHVAPYGAMLVAALCGREEEATALLDAVAERAAMVGHHFEAQYTWWARAVLFNGLGRYDQALAAALRASAEAPELWISGWALPELVEAAVRSENAAMARDALERLTEAAQAADTDWVRGVEARSRGLLSDGDDAERLYQEAVERLGLTELRPELARAHLLYGEWLRRRGRRVDARAELRTAYSMFNTIGMEAFAERARRELLATGERVPKRAAHVASDDLTAQERQIAWLVREGLSNPEVGSRLFLSPRTVEWHLRKVFAKLSITSRKELREVLRAPDDT